MFSVANYFAVISFVIFLSTLIFFLYKYIKMKTTQVKSKSLDPDTMVLYTTQSGIYIRKTKMNLLGKENHLKIRRKNKVNFVSNYTKKICDVEIQNSDIF